jgi:hypothetical protein
MKKHDTICQFNETSLWVLRCQPIRGGVSQKPVMTFQFPVGPIQDRIVKTRFGQSWFHIIQKDRGRHTITELECPDVAFKPGGRILAEDKAHKAMAALGKSLDKSPGPTRFACFRIDHHAGVAKIYLLLTAWPHFKPDRYGWRSQLKLPLRPTIPLHHTIADGQPRFFAEEPPDLCGRNFFPLGFNFLKQPINPLPVWSNLILSGILAKKEGNLDLLQRTHQLSFLRKGASLLPSCGLGQPDVLADRVPVKSQGALDSFKTSPLRPLVNHLDDLVHKYLPSGHRPSPFKFLALRIYPLLGFSTQTQGGELS